MNPSVCTIRSEVARLFLTGGNRVFSLPIDELAAAYNGTGPAFLPARIRARLDRIASPFLPAVMVHDVDYTFSDGTVASFRKANARLLVNCVRCALDAHPWHSWRRYALLLEAAAIYRACRRFGWIAWRSAYRKNTVPGVPPRPASPHAHFTVPEAPTPRGGATTNKHQQQTKE